MPKYQYHNTYEVIQDKQIVLKDTIVDKSGLFFPKSDVTVDFQRISQKLEEMFCCSDNTNCLFCEIIYDKTQNHFKVDKNIQRCPTTVDKQIDMQKEGFWLICNLKGWHILNELLIPIEHINSAYELSSKLQLSLLHFIERRWNVYYELQSNLIVERDIIDDLWLCMTTNDRLGASVKHLHSHVSLSPYSPIGLLEKLNSSWIALIGETKYFRLCALHGLGSRIIVQGKQNFNAKYWIINPIIIKNWFQELAEIRVILINMIKELYKNHIPFNEGLFAPYSQEIPMLYAIFPYVPNGALEQFRGEKFFRVTAENNASLFRNWLHQNSELLK